VARRSRPGRGVVGLLSRGLAALAVGAASAEGSGEEPGGEAGVETAGEAPSAVHSLLQARGLPRALQSLQKRAVEMLPASGCDTTWGDRVEGAFAPDAVLEATARHLEARWAPEHAEAARALLAGEPAERLQQAEAWMRATARPPGSGVPPRPAATTAEPEGERSRILERLAEASDAPATAATARVQIKRALGRICGGLRAESENQRDLLATLHRLEIAEARRHLDVAFASAARRAYEPLSDAELRRWVEDLESPAARWLAEALRAALLAALEERAGSLEPSPL